MRNFGVDYGEQTLELLLDPEHVLLGLRPGAWGRGGRMRFRVTCRGTGASVNRTGMETDPDLTLGILQQRVDVLPVLQPDGGEDGSLV